MAHLIFLLLLTAVIQMGSLTDGFWGGNSGSGNISFKTLAALFSCAAVAVCAYVSMSATTDENEKAFSVNSCLAGNDPIKSQPTFDALIGYRFFNALPADKSSVKIDGDWVVASEITGSKDYFSSSDKGTRYFTSIISVSRKGDAKSDMIALGHIDEHDGHTKEVVDMQVSVNGVTGDEAVRYGRVMACIGHAGPGL